MKEPSYNSRDIKILNNADRMILRLFINGEWRVSTEYPLENENMLTCAERVRSNLIEATRHHYDLSRVALYIGGPIDDTVGMVSIPRNYIPNQVRDILLSNIKKENNNE